MMEEIDRFQVPAVRAEMQPLVRGGWARPGCPRQPPPHRASGRMGVGAPRGGGGGAAELRSGPRAAAVL